MTDIHVFDLWDGSDNDVDTMAFVNVSPDEWNDPAGLTWNPFASDDELVGACGWADAEEAALAAEAEDELLRLEEAEAEEWDDWADPDYRF